MMIIVRRNCIPKFFRLLNLGLALRTAYVRSDEPSKWPWPLHVIKAHGPFECKDDRDLCQSRWRNKNGRPQHPPIPPQPMPLWRTPPHHRPQKTRNFFADPFLFSCFSNIFERMQTGATGPTCCRIYLFEYLDKNATYECVHYFWWSWVILI